MGFLWWLFSRPANFEAILAAISAFLNHHSSVGSMFYMVYLFPFYPPTSINLVIDWVFFIHSLNMPKPYKVLCDPKHLLYWQYPTYFVTLLMIVSMTKIIFRTIRLSVFWFSTSSFYICTKTTLIVLGPVIGWAIYPIR